MICPTTNTDLTPDNIVLGAQIKVTVVYSKWVNPDFILELAPYYLTDLTGNSTWAHLEITSVVARELDTNTWLAQTIMRSKYGANVKETRIVVRLVQIGVRPNRYEVAVMSPATWERYRPR